MAKLHFPNLVCLQQVCSRSEDAEDIESDCVQCGVRKHYSCDDPVGSMLSCVYEPIPWVNKVVTIAHTVKAFDLHFILNPAVLLKWRLELIMNGLKIMCMMVEHLLLLHSLSFLPCSLSNLSEEFGQTASKCW